MKEKVLAIVLSLSMVIALAPTIISAEEIAAGEPVEQVEEVNKTVENVTEPEAEVQPIEAVDEAKNEPAEAIVSEVAEEETEVVTAAAEPKFKLEVTKSGNSVNATVTLEEGSTDFGGRVKLIQTAEGATPFNSIVPKGSGKWSKTDWAILNKRPVTFSVQYEKSSGNWVDADCNEIQMIALNVAFNANGGTGGPATAIVTDSLGSVEVTIPSGASDKPTMSGMTFKGWADTATATTVQYQPGQKYTFTKSTTLYAVYEWNLILCLHDPRDITSGWYHEKVSVPRYPGTYTLNSSDFDQTKLPEGKVIDFWSLDKDATSGIDDGTTVTLSAEDVGLEEQNAITYHSMWKTEETTYDISYDGLEGATLSKENPTEYTEDTDTFTLNNPTKEGYEFLGWTGNGVSTPTKTMQVKKGSTGDITFTANWKEVEPEPEPEEPDEPEKKGVQTGDPNDFNFIWVFCLATMGFCGLAIKRKED